MTTTLIDYLNAQAESHGPWTDARDLLAAAIDQRALETGIAADPTNDDREHAESLTTPATTYAIRHTHGLTEYHDTWASAWAALVAVYGAETYAVDANGWDIDGDTTPDISTGCALVWQDEASSEDDDGARAVASITASAEG